MKKVSILGSLNVGDHIIRIKLFLQESTINHKNVLRPIFYIYDQIENDPKSMRHRIIKSISTYNRNVYFTNNKNCNTEQSVLSVDKINSIFDYDNNAVIGCKSFSQDIPKIKTTIMKMMAEHLALKLKKIIESDKSNSIYNVAYSLLLNSDEIEVVSLSEI